MLSTLLGIEMESKLSQPLNALPFIRVTPLGIFTDLREVHPLNILSEIEDIALPIVADSKLLQSSYLLLVDYQYYTL